MKDTPIVTGDPRPDTGVGCYCLRCIPVTVLGTSRIQQVVNMAEGWSDYQMSPHKPEVRLTNRLQTDSPGEPLRPKTTGGGVSKCVCDEYGVNQ